MRKILWILCLSLCVGSAFGCATERSTIFSYNYWKRHAAKIADDLHQFRVDIDRTIFDLEERPIEQDF